MAITDLLKRWWDGGEVRDYPSLIEHVDLQRIFGVDDSIEQARVNARMSVEMAAAKSRLVLSGGFATVWQTPLESILTDLVRDVLEYGNAVFEISDDPPMLRRASTFEIHGVRSLRYRLEFNGPDGTQGRNVPADGVLHTYVNSTRQRPFVGVSPFRPALLRACEMGMLDLARLRNKRLLTMPKPQYDVQQNDTDQERAGFEIGLALNRPGTDAFYNETSRGTPVEIATTDLRFDPSQNAVTLRRDLVSEIYGAVGLPRVLWQSENPPGMAVIEAHAGWVDGWLDPFLNGLAMQISKALETTVSFDVSTAKITQVRHQAETVKTLVEAGLALEDAKRIAGL